MAMGAAAIAAIINVSMLGMLGVDIRSQMRDREVL
jgi:hypothetical protein